MWFPNAWWWSGGGLSFSAGFYSGVVGRGQAPAGLVTAGSEAGPAPGPPAGVGGSWLWPG